MTHAPLYISQEALDNMKVEMEQMTTVGRRELANRIEKAKDLGDLRENADYQSAKEELADLEVKIAEYKAAMMNSVIISASSGGDVVEIGSTITITTADGKEKSYTIVGAREAKPLEGKISNESPIGQALIGRKVGEEIEFKAPSGTIMYTVSKIH